MVKQRTLAESPSQAAERIDAEPFPQNEEVVVDRGRCRDTCLSAYAVTAKMKQSRSQSTSRYPLSSGWHRLDRVKGTVEMSA